MVKKVLVNDRLTVEVWYALPNRGAIEYWNNWLPGRNPLQNVLSFSGESPTGRN
jgi:hypothetical protein